MMRWILCLLLCFASATAFPQTLPKEKVKKIKALFLTADGIGDIHFKVKEEMESMGIKVTVAGLTKVCASCPNKKQRPVTCDLMISEVKDVTKYHCVFVASGKQHRILSKDETCLALLKRAHKKGLVISSICAGNVVLAKAGLFSGIKTAGFPYVDPLTIKSGGCPDPKAKVAAHNRIVTGGPGGGKKRGGFHKAPAAELCQAVVMEVLKLSYIEELRVNSQGIWIKSPNTNFKIRAFIHQGEKIAWTRPIPLKIGENPLDGLKLKPGKHLIDVEILSSNGHLEVQRHPYREVKKR